MPVFKKIKAKAKSSRGGGPDFVLKEFEDNYAEWMKSLEEMDDAGRDELKEEFNALWEDAEIGDSIIEMDNGVSFKMAKADLNTEQVKAFVNLLCPKYFDCEGYEPE